MRNTSGVTLWFIDAPYEPPPRPDVHLRTDRMSLEQEVALILDAVAYR